MKANIDRRQPYEHLLPQLFIIYLFIYLPLGKHLYLLVSRKLSIYVHGGQTKEIGCYFMHGDCMKYNPSHQLTAMN